MFTCITASDSGYEPGNEASPPLTTTNTHISLHTRAFVPLVSLLLYQAQTQTKNIFSLCFHSHAISKNKVKDKSKNKVKDKSRQNSKKISPPGNLFQCRSPHAQKRAEADQIGGEHQGSRQAANSPGNIMLKCNYLKTEFEIFIWSPWCCCLWRIVCLLRKGGPELLRFARGLSMGRRLSLRCPKLFDM